VDGDAGVSIRTLPGAEWAVFGHAGCLAQRRKLYGDAYRTWIPSLGHRAAAASPHERYACTGGRVEYGVAEIHIPLEPR
jgi:predicted transcriptional regulator YdeE